MHVAAAIRYAATGFVTNDQGLLKRDAVIQEVLHNFRILTPRAALDLTERQVAKVEELARRNADPDKTMPGGS